MNTVNTETETLAVVRLNDRDTAAIVNALHIAAEQFDGHVKEFRKLAEQLRAGATMPLWAEGEKGALAAERTGQQFERQAKHVRELCERVSELGADFALVPYSED